jgi:hypothetical protein
VVEDRPRARRGRVVPIQFVFAHTNGRERNARLRTAGALAQQVRLRLANIKVRTGRSQDTEYGAPGRWELQHITAKTTTARWSCPLLCSALLWHASCSLHPHCTKFEPATEQQDFFLFDRTRVCVFPRPSPDVGEQGTLSWLVHFMQAFCRMTLRLCRMARQPLKIQRIEPLASCLALRRARERTWRAHGILSLRRGDYSITVLLSGTSYRDGFDSQL